MQSENMVHLYRANANAHRRYADETPLRNVRAIHIEAARRWASLAELAERLERRD